MIFKQIKSRNIISLIIFILIFIVYAISSPRTITFWDSAEFVSSSFNLQATHPPGSPFYTMLCSVIMQFFSVTNIAFVSNLISSFFGALTVTFLFKIVYFITTKIQNNKSEFETKLLPYFTGVTSALTLAFSNSFWTASTETEVYTLSFALMTIIIFVMLKWEGASNKEEETKLILLFSFLLGIVTGVHLIIISIIIPITLLYTHKKYGLTIKNTILSLIIGCVLFLSIYMFAIQGVIKLANNLDIWLVNTFKTSVNTGTIIILFLLIFFFLITQWITYKKQKSKLHHITLSILFFFIGISSYIMPMQRVNANTQIANGVSTSNRMLKYIKGEQFGINNIPLLKGYTYNAPLDKNSPFIDGEPVLTYDSNRQKYITVDNGKYSKTNYSDEFSMYFPRLFNKKNEHKYKLWTTIKGDSVNYSVNGETKTIYRPTNQENFNFFIDYQVSWLYLRYLYWNFIGKQNSNHGIGYIKDGNWVSGINSIDKLRVGDISNTPMRFINDKSRNTYYFIPFILGFIGLLSLIRHKHYFLTTIFIFLAFGIGITIYINPVPHSILVRERDYIFIGSFIIFSLWVGLSILLIYNSLKSIFTTKIRLIVVSILVLIGAPLQMLAKGWNDHQRSHDSFSYDFGKAYLDACPKQAILITNGDNMTFPLWYLQEVEKYRTDVRVLNYDQLNLDVNIQNLKKEINTSNPLEFNLDSHLYIDGVDRLIPLQRETNNAAVLTNLFNFLNDSTTLINWNGKLKHYMPTTTFSIPIDTLKIRKHGLNLKELNAIYTPEIKWHFAKNFYELKDIVLLNIITKNIHNRPICFADNGKKNHYIGLQNYFVKNGMVEQLAPLKRKKSLDNPKIVNTTMMYPYVMDKLHFKGLNHEKKYINSENRTYVQDIIRPNYYFLAQALIEEGKTKEAIAVLDKSFTIFPNKTIPYKQYAFALGKLYFRAGLPEKGTEICTMVMENFLEELTWITSFNPPQPMINIKHAEKLKNMYIQMLEQFPGNKTTLKNYEQRFEALEVGFVNWKKTNWPY
ncbi:protein O-mannosyl-transferase family [Aurantibacter sp.]|uniref:protein O-mannosyl-transferase family n=1 Tax=Aurantibacter sp. TaxID=2807103 RepID=UPI0035C7EB1C